MGAKLLITARQTFDPASVVRVRAAVQEPNGLFRRARRDLRPASYRRLLVAFYRDPLAWLGLLVSLLILAYLGGAVMFVLHAVILGELGPAISPGAHWTLDSTLGFIGLAPALALIIPLAAWAACADAGPARPATFASVGGVLFALATAPGPIAHDMLVGRGTWLANRVTDLLGAASAVEHARHAPPVSEALSIGSQVAVGVPTYIVLVWLALLTVRKVVQTRHATRQASAILASRQVIRPGAGAGAGPNPGPRPGPVRSGPALLTSRAGSSPSPRRRAAFAAPGRHRAPPGAPAAEASSAPGCVRSSRPPGHR